MPDYKNVKWSDIPIGPLDNVVAYLINEATGETWKLEGTQWVKCGAPVVHIVPDGTTSIEESDCAS